MVEWSMDYLLYWWKDTSHTDPWTQGYVGITNNNKRRTNGHKCRSQWFRDDLEQVILIEGLTQEEAMRIERQYRPADCIGWNVATGGSGGHSGRVWTDEMRQAMSDIQSNADWKSRPETRKAQSEAHMGKTLSEAHRESIRKAALGKKRGPYGPNPERRRKDVPRYTSGKMKGKINYQLIKKLQTDLHITGETHGC